jgi:hypothetical protein
VTIAHPTDPTLRRSDTVMTRAASYASPSEDKATDWSNWENWIAGHKAELGEEIVEAIGQEMIGPLAKRLRALELELAQTRGAVDVLRGRGQPGCFRARGVYDGKAAYNQGDVVVKDSSSFVALRDKPETCPGDDWQMIACGGKRGPAGERGPAGPAGIPPTFLGTRFGAKGMTLETSAGPIPVIKSVAVDDKYFTIKIYASDDSTLSISLLPLFEAYHRQTTTR